MGDGIPEGTLMGLLGIKFVGIAAEWFMSLQDCPTSCATIHQFAAVFRERFCKQVIYKPHHARNKLISGHVFQRHNQDVQTYHQHFKHVTDQATSMAELDKIAWFIHGLKPELRSMCVVDSMGIPWTSFKPLLNYAVGAEMRLQQTNHVQSRPNKFKRHHASQDSDHGAGPSRPTPMRTHHVQASPAKRAHQGYTSTMPGPSPKKNTHYPTSRVVEWGPVDAENTKFPHLSNGEVHRRFNDKVCCFCGRPGHKAKDCKDPAKSDNSKRR